LVKDSLTITQQKQLEQLKNAPSVEARLARADCSPPSASDTLVIGQFVRQSGGAALGNIEAHAVYEGRTIPASVSETRRSTNSVDFQISDPFLAGNMPVDLPIAYTVTMRLPSSGVRPNVRVPIRWKWSPLVSTVGPLSDVRLTRSASGEIVVRLPEIRVRQVGKLVAHLTRSGSTGSLQTEEFRVLSSDYESGYIYREVIEARFRAVPAAWRGSDPVTWDGVVELEGSADATDCSGGRRPSNRLRIPYSRTAAAPTPPSTSSDEGQYYRVYCTCNNEYQYADAQLKACNVGGVGVALRCGQLANTMNKEFPGPWQCLLTGSEAHSDESACNPITENFMIDSLELRKK
jgi:hypothetical protein